MNDELCFFNGVNGADGTYLVPPMSLPELEGIALGAPRDVTFRDRSVAYRAQQGPDKLGPDEEVDPLCLASSGWGIVINNDDPRKQDIEEKLAPLLALRQKQAGDNYRCYPYHSGHSAKQFLAANNAVPQEPANPVRFGEEKSVPYYLLLAGDPVQIPFRVQYGLDMQYAVGRIHFDDLEGYARYARSVVSAEEARPALPPRAAFLGPSFDRHTAISASQLIAPLAADLARRQQRRLEQDPAPQNPGPTWLFDSFTGAEADLARLKGHLGGEKKSAFVLMATHGLYYPIGDGRQLDYTGALLVEKPKLLPAGGISLESAYSIDNVDPGDDYAGQIAFFMACYGAGTPKISSFSDLLYAGVLERAQASFVAALPQRLLGHDNGALAVVGHIDQATDQSFHWRETGSELGAYASAISRILAGQPIGHAMDYFDRRQTVLASMILNEKNLRQSGQREMSASELVTSWIANNDARNYVIIGDPAVRLKLA